MDQLFILGLLQGQYWFHQGFELPITLVEISQNVTSQFTTTCDL